MDPRISLCSSEDDGPERVLALRLHEDDERGRDLVLRISRLSEDDKSEKCARPNYAKDLPALKLICRGCRTWYRFYKKIKISFKQ